MGDSLFYNLQVVLGGLQFFACLADGDFAFLIFFGTDQFVLVKFL